MTSSKLGCPEENTSFRLDEKTMMAILTPQRVQSSLAFLFLNKCASCFEKVTKIWLSLVILLMVILGPPKMILAILQNSHKIDECIKVPDFISMFGLHGQSIIKLIFFI